MRLWSLHPSYLDSQGLVACWREALLARKVLSGATKGYRSHPQLIRFRQTSDPQAAINTYLAALLAEAKLRNYRFDNTKVSLDAYSEFIHTTTGQLQYEFEHLKQKLILRAPTIYRLHESEKEPTQHPLFTVIDGPIEPWEIIH